MFKLPAHAFFRRVCPQRHLVEKRLHRDRRLGSAYHRLKHISRGHQVSQFGFGRVVLAQPGLRLFREHVVRPAGHHRRGVEQVEQQGLVASTHLRQIHL
ncbi:hypothetical protein A5722_00200 [Mycobacterium vulneris]|nr:hypothetical protein A5722_00200 [Mycolicibacterium vulneris]OCB68216.1 hypothetical protein A5729_04875 [Mycolicibacterium vulneris]